MFDDPMVARVAIVGVLLVISLSIAYVARRGMAFIRRPFPGSGLDPGVTLFTSETCATCDRARASLSELEIPFEEITYEERPSVFDDLGITGVPSVVIVAGDGRAWIVRGHPSRGRLRRWVSDAGP